MWVQVFIGVVRVSGSAPSVKWERRRCTGEATVARLIRRGERGSALSDTLCRLAKVLGIAALVAVAATALRRLLRGGGPATPQPEPPSAAPRERPMLSVVEPQSTVHTVEDDTVPDDIGVHEATDEVEHPDGAGWLEPVDGACPVSHPVKVKTSSGIFHVPGGANYERTSPDRCYTDAAAAEADGYRAAKR